MVLEMMVEMSGGQGYTNIFAETGSDPSVGWKLMDPSRFKYSGGTYGRAVNPATQDFGDPTIRYLPSDGYYYIVVNDPQGPMRHFSSRNLNFSPTELCGPSISAGDALPEVGACPRHAGHLPVLLHAVARSQQGPQLRELGRLDSQPDHGLA